MTPNSLLADALIHAAIGLILALIDFFSSVYEGGGAGKVGTYLLRSRGFTPVWYVQPLGGWAALACGAPKEASRFGLNSSLGSFESLGSL
jgi:hypothetical protein